MKIILDAMGGDYAPEAPVLGALEAAKCYGSQIVLVGRGEEILDVMKRNGIETLPDGVEIAVSSKGELSRYNANQNGVDLNHNFDAGFAGNYVD